MLKLSLAVFKYRNALVLSTLISLVLFIFIIIFGVYQNSLLLFTLSLFQLGHLLIFLDHTTGFLLKSRKKISAQLKLLIQLIGAVTVLLLSGYVFSHSFSGFDRSLSISSIYTSVLIAIITFLGNGLILGVVRTTQLNKIEREGVRRLSTMMFGVSLGIVMANIFINFTSVYVIDFFLSLVLSFSISLLAIFKLIDTYWIIEEHCAKSAHY